MVNSKNRLSIRKVKKTDLELLFDWSNDPVVRRWSFKKHFLSMDEHKNWFNQRINNENVFMWIFEYNNSPAGIVRIEKNNEEFILNYQISPKSRGKGLATQMLKMTIDEFRNLIPNSNILGYTFPDNIASIKSMERAGFVLNEQLDNKILLCFLNKSINNSQKKMKILLLGPKKTIQKKLKEFLINDGNDIEYHNNELDIENIAKNKYDFLISFGYPYIVSKSVLEYFNEKAINCHISYLPWNRGSDPNLWSILEKTPKGVTIHQMINKLDAGKILFQKKTELDSNDTLKSSFDKLEYKLLELFKEKWQYIKTNDVNPKVQNGKGSYHKLSDKNNYLYLLSNSWNTKIKCIEGKALNV